MYHEASIRYNSGNSKFEQTSVYSVFLSLHFTEDRYLVFGVDDFFDEVLMWCLILYPFWTPSRTGYLPMQRQI